ncbi:MAG: CDP-alcohol phosphatidyltransferase family protein [Clostridia bacterium]|nr:CDP-alcohol phosphatidyltransferase family protein [Clostridia bacterium]
MIFNLPNILTIFRLLLVPALPPVYFAVENGRYVALGIFLLAGFTDVLDGYIARKRNIITDFGKLADPLADKLIQITLIICLCVDGFVPLWLTLCFLVKELVLVCGACNLVRLNEVVVHSKWSGKIATAAFYAAACVSMLFPQSPQALRIGLFVLAFLLTFLAFIDYYKWYRQIKHPSSKN